MKLTSLRLHNFRQHVATEIQFESGITGIIGPNGSGKTTILEAIAFALYSIGRTTREQMLSQHPVGRPQMRIELGFELGRHNYRVVRGRNSAELYLDGDPTPIASTPTAVTDRLQHESRRVLQHLLHRTEGARGDGRDGRARSRPFPVEGARI